MLVLLLLETAVLLLRTLDLLSIERSALVLGDVSVLAGIFGGLPESRAGSVTAVLGGQMIEREWGGLTAVFSSGG